MAANRSATEWLEQKPRCSLLERTFVLAPILRGLHDKNNAAFHGGRALYFGIAFGPIVSNGIMLRPSMDQRDAHESQRQPNPRAHKESQMKMYTPAHRWLSPRGVPDEPQQWSD